MDEFQLIERFFANASQESSVHVGIGDDGAVVSPEPDRCLVAAVDTQIEGVHFPECLRPADIGFRAVAVNLSDIAAMGARPRWMTLALTLVDADSEWLAAFARGLFDAAGEHGVSLIGGDTTQGRHIVVSVQLLGDAAYGEVLKRSGARVGDRVYVSGFVGEAAAGLSLLESGSAAGGLVDRFARPTARVELGQHLRCLASAAIDVSDGLVADLEKLLDASVCGAEIDLDRILLSEGLVRHAGVGEARRLALTGGDDYELCFTAPAENEARLVELAETLRVPLTKFGSIVAGRGITARQDGRAVAVDSAGYRHFS